jgi:hypothetical protein
MMAPPQVQAQSFAIAIRTDIPNLFSRPLSSWSRQELVGPSARRGCRTGDANSWFKRKRVNPDLPVSGRIGASLFQYRTVVRAM